MKNEVKNNIPGFVSQRTFQKANEKHTMETRQDGKFSDPVSREMVAAAGDKGSKGEYIVAEMFSEMGYEVMVLFGQKSHDVKVKIKGEWHRVEVKTSTQKGNANNFCFAAIKTRCYDLLATVFVGYDYTSVQISGKEGKRFIDTWGSTIETKPGRWINFNSFRTHCKLQGMEIFFDMTKKNVERLV
jgi:hypothetical protein